MATVIYVDFNTMTAPPIRKVRIHTKEAQRVGLDQSYVGSQVKLADSEIAVDGILEFDETNHMWFAQPIWESRVDLPASETVIGFVNAPAATKLNVLHVTVDVGLASIERTLAALSKERPDLDLLEGATRQINATINELRKAGALLDPYPESKSARGE